MTYSSSLNTNSLVKEGDGFVNVLGSPRVFPYRVIFSGPKVVYVNLNPEI